jgi:hypothetical protein
MKTPEENDPLDALLREQNQYVEDDGFTARVLTNLPRRHSWFWLRQIFLLGAAIVGFVLATLWLPWGKLPALNWSALFSANFQILSPWLLVFLILASLIWSIIAAIQFED